MPLPSPLWRAVDLPSRACCEPQLYRRLHFLNVLPTGTGGAQEVLVQFRVVDRHRARDPDQHRRKSGMSLCSLSEVARRDGGSVRSTHGMANQLPATMGRAKATRAPGPAQQMLKGRKAEQSRLPTQPHRAASRHVSRQPETRRVTCRCGSRHPGGIAEQGNIAPHTVTGPAVPGLAPSASGELHHLQLCPCGPNAGEMSADGCIAAKDPGDHRYCASICQPAVPAPVNADRNAKASL